MTLPDLSRVSPVVRDELIDALRSGTVPARGLDLVAVGVDRYAELLDEDARVELPLGFDARGADFRAFVERVGLGPVLAIVTKRVTLG